ncbi:MAG: aldose epimerase family protein [Chitinophagales bacterium]
MEKAGQSCFTHPSGKDVYLYRLCNINKTEVLITNYGAIIMAYKIFMPDKTANDIVLGFENVHDYLNADYLKVYPFMGAAIGRYANRIKNASFRIDDKEFSVSKNWGNEQLHGGLEGFDKKVWDFVSFDEKCNILQMKYNSPDGEEGFPGNLEVTICFELNDENDLIYEYTASCDRPTAVNLTQHSYFNLNNGEGTIHDHEVKIYSDKILEQDENLVTTGNYIAVDNTKYDFRQFEFIDERINGGYDQSFVVEKKEDQLSTVAEVLSKKSGLRLQVLTTEPLVHLYTGQGFPKIKGKNSTEYGPYSGLCLETQKHPNAINIPKFPNTVLRPGEKYYQKNVYKIARLEVASSR